VSSLKFRRKALEGLNIPNVSSSRACECVFSCQMQHTCHQYLAMGYRRGRSRAVPVCALQGAPKVLFVFKIFYPRYLVLNSYITLPAFSVQYYAWVQSPNLFYFGGRGAEIFYTVLGNSCFNNKQIGIVFYFSIFFSF
jgi:hypothetical protein